MNNLAYIIEEIHQFYTSSFRKLACFGRSTWLFYTFIYQFVVVRLNSFIIRACHFVFASTIGFLALKAFKSRTAADSIPRNLDLFFTSVSAVTTSSMSTVEMEVFSDSQLIVITMLMFVGGEVFVSVMGIHSKTSKFVKETDRKVGSSFSSDSSPGVTTSQIELNSINHPQLPPGNNNEVQIQIETPSSSSDVNDNNLKYNAVKFLERVVFFYLFGIQFLGVTFVSLYLTTISSAKNVLKSKGLNTFTFSIFTVVSTFSNCGFIPTNENMMVFGKNSGLLSMLILLALLGNTLFPPFLRLTLRLFGKSSKRERQSKYLLNNAEDSGYRHLLSSMHSWFLGGTVLGLIAVQFVTFSVTEWYSEALVGLSAYQKLIGALFQCVNSRHAGETIVNLSIISPAVLVMFIVAMYLPPYTSFLPINCDSQLILKQSTKTRSAIIVENIVFSQLSYLTMFIILVCITERNKMKEDPLNFNVLNIVVEVISAYGNVGFSTGYSCELQLVKDASCKDKWFGFSGMWSDEGKIVLIIVMFFGRLKNFNMDGGKAWKLM